MFQNSTNSTILSTRHAERSTVLMVLILGCCLLLIAGVYLGILVCKRKIGKVKVSSIRKTKPVSGGAKGTTEKSKRKRPNVKGQKDTREHIVKVELKVPKSSTGSPAPKGLEPKGSDSKPSPKSLEPKVADPKPVVYSKDTEGGGDLTALRSKDSGQEQHELRQAKGESWQEDEASDDSDLDYEQLEPNASRGSLVFKKTGSKDSHSIRFHFPAPSDMYGFSVLSEEE